MQDIAVLLTCFNRREKTLRCLDRLFQMSSDLAVYLVDDGCNDGTGDAVAELFPKVVLIRGSGDLFWSGGMRTAWARASAHDHAYYLWLNDDVVLDSTALSEMFESATAAGRRSIISGIIASPDREKILYGGTDSGKQILKPSGKLQAITNMNGNVVLVSREVFRELGNIDRMFIHDLGDVDYGLRAIAGGISVYSSRAVVGTCEPNELCRVRKAQVTFAKRLQNLYSPLGSNPIVGFRFRRRHYGLPNAIGYFVFVHLINAMSDRLTRRIFGGRYL